MHVRTRDGRSSAFPNLPRRPTGGRARRPFLPSAQRFHSLDPNEIRAGYNKPNVCLASVHPTYRRRCPGRAPHRQLLARHELRPCCSLQPLGSDTISSHSLMRGGVLQLRLGCSTTHCGRHATFEAHEPRYGYENVVISGRRAWVAARYSPRRARGSTRSSCAPRRAGVIGHTSCGDRRHRRDGRVAGGATPPRLGLVDPAPVGDRRRRHPPHRPGASARSSPTGEQPGIEYAYWSDSTPTGRVDSRPKPSPGHPDPPCTSVAYTPVPRLDDRPRRRG